jgi:glutathionylspermidine synthase
MGMNMERINIEPRNNWQMLVEDAGFTYHTREDGTPYWEENKAYKFTEEEIKKIESVTAELQKMFLKAIQIIFEKNWLQRLNIPVEFEQAVTRSWQRGDLNLYGRFDLIQDGAGELRLYEYNADTPLTLFETARIQRNWFKDKAIENASQFNIIEDKLTAAWPFIAERYANKTGLLHFSCAKEFAEDIASTKYMQQLAQKSGVKTKMLFIDEIGWEAGKKNFVDLENAPMKTLFKTYPWEWMAGEDFGKYMTTDTINVIEPIWKLILTNKAVMAVMWELFPGHPNLIPAYFDSGELHGSYVKRVKASREGQNITVVKNGERIFSTDESDGAEYIFQALVEPTKFDQDYAFIGSWIVGNTPAGIGVREDVSLGLSSRSRFVPHFVTK